MYAMTLFYHDPKADPMHLAWSSAVVVMVAVTIGLLLTQRWRAYLQSHGWIARTGGLPWFRLIAGITIMALVEMFLVFCTYLIVDSTSEAEVLEWLRQGALGTMIGWVSIYTGWTVLYIAIVSRRHTRRMEIEKLQLELHVKEAELRALQAQVNPHFFFNSLNSIRALIYQDAEGAAEVIDRLASMMRYTLQSGRANTVPLEQEMKAVHDYLAIEKIRFEDRLQFSEDIDPQLDRMAFPPMILQTLVENAVKYGVELSNAPCQLKIGAQRDGEQMQLTVSNQGQLREVDGSTKVGVRNAGKRLALIFGGSAGVDLFERDGWVTARLLLPCMPFAAS
jgi:hypothetical protein